jgi:hypothetical protein
MLKPELLRVLALTGASVTISDVPGVISLHAFARNVRSTHVRLASSLWLHTLADIRDGGPVAPSTQIYRCQRRKGMRAVDASESRDRCAADFDPIAIDVARTVGGTNDNGHWPFGAFSGCHMMVPAPVVPAVVWA